MSTITSTYRVAAQKAYSCTEAERVQPKSANAAAHDAITRLLHRMEPSSEQLWQEAQQQVRLNQGVLVIDDSTVRPRLTAEALDKLYAKKMELVSRHWSGKQRTERLTFNISLSAYLLIQFYCNSIRIKRFWSFRYYFPIKISRRI